MPAAGVVTFDMKDRRVRFAVSWKEKATGQSIRSLWRALMLCIRAKLASVESDIETFKEAFLAHIVSPDDNRTVYERMKPHIAALPTASMPGRCCRWYRGRLPPSRAGVHQETTLLSPSAFRLRAQPKLSWAPPNQATARRVNHRSSHVGVPEITSTATPSAQTPAANK
jgi:hypothetical protein